MEFFGERFKGVSGFVAGDNRERSSPEMRSKENLLPPPPNIHVGKAKSPQPPVMRKKQHRPPVIGGKEPRPLVETPRPPPGENRTPRPPNCIMLAYPPPAITRSVLDMPPPPNPMTFLKHRLPDIIAPSTSHLSVPNNKITTAVEDSPPLPPKKLVEHGFHLPYLRKFPFEDMEHIDDSEFYSELHYPFDEIKPNTYELVKRFLKQVRDSEGYDVDCCPPRMFGSPFAPVDVKKAVDNSHYEWFILKPARFAIRGINAQLGRNFELLEIQKAVDTTVSMLFLTFTAKEEVPNADAHVETFQAQVIAKPWEKHMRLVEWRVKPVPSDHNP